MSEPPSPKSESVLTNPQIVIAIISGIITVLVAVIGILPNLLNPPITPTPVIVTATPLPPTATPVPPTSVAAQVVVPTDTPAPPASTPIPTATPVPSTPTSPPTDTPVPPTATSVPASPTPLPTDTPPPPPTNTPAPQGNVQLLYDDVAFTLINQDSRALSLEGVLFRSASGQWEAVQWGVSLHKSLPAGMCLRMRDAFAGQRQPPRPCVDKIYGFMEVGQSALFWLGVAQFEVVRAGQVIATCDVAAGSCLVYIP